MSKRKILSLERKIKKTQESLSQLGALRPGSLSKQFNVCGNPDCRCKDPVKPKKHGPYHNLSYTWKGKGKTEFVSAEFVSEVKSQIKNYKKMRALIDQWIELSIELAALKKQVAKNNKATVSYEMCQ